MTALSTLRSQSTRVLMEKSRSGASPLKVFESRKAVDDALEEWNLVGDGTFYMNKSFHAAVNEATLRINAMHRTWGELGVNRASLVVEPLVSSLVNEGEFCQVGMFYPQGIDGNLCYFATWKVTYDCPTYCMKAISKWNFVCPRPCNLLDDSDEESLSCPDEISFCRTPPSMLPRGTPPYSPTSPPYSPTSPPYPPMEMERDMLAFKRFDDKHGFVRSEKELADLVATGGWFYEHADGSVTF